VAIDAARFDRVTLETYIRGDPEARERYTQEYAVGPDKPPTQLDAADRAALAAPEVQQAAAALGYRLDP
jgi:hypothetical protein